ncbi:MAG: hypothetical protein ACLR6I_17455 [Waltera sp.]
MTEVSGERGNYGIRGSCGSRERSSIRRATENEILQWNSVGKRRRKRSAVTGAANSAWHMKRRTLQDE